MVGNHTLQNETFKHTNTHRCNLKARLVSRVIQSLLSSSIHTLNGFSSSILYDVRAWFCISPLFVMNVCAESASWGSDVNTHTRTTHKTHTYALDSTLITHTHIHTHTSVILFRNCYVLPAPCTSSVSAYLRFVTIFLLEKTRQSTRSGGTGASCVRPWLNRA